MKHGATRPPNRRKQPSLAQRLKTADVTNSIIVDVLEAIDHPYGLSVAIKLRYGDYAGAVSTSIDPKQFDDVNDFADAYQSVKLISKYPHLDTGINRQLVALQAFHLAESVCKETNERFRRLREGKGEFPNPVVQAIISMAARKISHILGDVDLSSISEQFGWGPGASIGIRGHHTSAYNKFSGPLDVTRNGLMMGLCCINSIPSWANAVAMTDTLPSVPVSVLPNALRIVTGNEIIFVPKNAKTDRVIAIEPSLNGYIQKGFGRYIRKRLRERVGIDLKDQTINQSLAQYGSRTGELATIDLSMASDTIAKELVRELLPMEWFELLSSSRCEQGTVKMTGETVWFQKFSSMGNAYTFELESMIFYALAKACEEHVGGRAAGTGLRSVSVFGDDLIVPVDSVPILLEVLNYCGFTVNESKSYDSGPFRESCGKDFFRGTNVRPFFLKERIDNVEALYRVANGIRRYAHRRLGYLACDARFAQCWKRIVRTIPAHFRHYCPEGVGDVALISNFDEACPTRPKDGWEGYRTRVIHRVPYRTVYKHEMFGYTTSLFLAEGSRNLLRVEWLDSDSRRVYAELPEEEELPALGQYTLRDRTLPKIGQLLVRDWYNLGPWIL